MTGVLNYAGDEYCPGNAIGRSAKGPIFSARPRPPSFVEAKTSLAIVSTKKTPLLLARLQIER